MFGEAQSLQVLQEWIGPPVVLQAYLANSLAMAHKGPRIYSKVLKQGPYSRSTINGINQPTNSDNTEGLVVQWHNLLSSSKKLNETFLLNQDTNKFKDINMSFFLKKNLYHSLFNKIIIFINLFMMYFKIFDIRKIIFKLLK